MLSVLSNKLSIPAISEFNRLILLPRCLRLFLENKQQKPIYTFYAWLAYEETVYQISNFIDEKSE
jgi:hypothetical protein